MIVEGAPNFRDIGGYETGDGRRVKSGLLYRSDSLAKLKRSDWATLARKGFRSVADFREPAERAKSSYQLPNEITLYTLPIEVGGEEIRAEVEKVVRGRSDRDVNEFLVEIGRALVLEHSDVYARWLRLLIDDADNIPHVFHCTAGKDRTGFAAALLLRLLGVPHETVVADYLETNDNLRRFVKRVLRRVGLLTLSFRKPKIVHPLLVADERYLAASFDAIVERWGSFDTYLHEGLGLSGRDLQTLRERLLESAE
jgi:protein-tyrosine phosphatase